MSTTGHEVPGPPQSTCSILVVEDDPSTRELVTDILLLAGYSSETASNGAEALRLVEHHCPSLVLLDLHLPVVDGRQFAEELRQRGFDLPIVVMTGDPEARPAAAAIGAVGYLEKPFELSDVLNLVEAGCKRKRPWWAVWQRSERRA